MHAVVTTISKKVNENTGIFTPVDLKPLKILLQNWIFEYTMRCNVHAGFMEIDSGVSSPQIAVKRRAVSVLGARAVHRVRGTLSVD